MSSVQKALNHAKSYVAYRRSLAGEYTTTIAVPGCPGTLEDGSLIIAVEDAPLTDLIQGHIL